MTAVDPSSVNVPQTLSITNELNPDDSYVGVWVKQGGGDDSDVETGRCCPHCRHSLSAHNRAVYDAAYAMYKRHDPAPVPVSDEAEAAWHAWADERPGVTQHAAFLAGFRAARLAGEDDR